MSEDIDAKVMAVLSRALASSAGMGSVPTSQVIHAARERHGLGEMDILLALDRLAHSGRVMERNGDWSLRPQLGRLV